MLVPLTRRLLTGTEPRLLWRFAWSFGVKGAWNVWRFEKRLRRGRTFPAFLFLSVTNDCNLRCQGCWVTPTSPPARLDLETMNRVVVQTKRLGCSFFGILGGEPLRHSQVLDLFARHPDCYFQLFTNGTLLTDEVVRRLYVLGNVTPLISIEGDERVSDVRRGGNDVFRRSLEGIDRCVRRRLITGVATSVCRSNIEYVVSERFLEDLVHRGVLYVWYYLYRPVGPDPCPHLALTAGQILAVRRFLVTARRRTPLIIVDAYWDHEGNALCPAAVGISHLVNPTGDVEPCPVIQFARENLDDDANVIEQLTESRFLADFRRFAASTTRGCVIMEQPQALLTFLRRQGARDTTGRSTGWQELATMRPVPSHHLPGQEIPERNLLYRIAKKYWFFGFGAYG